MSSQVKLRNKRKQVGSVGSLRWKPTTMKMDDFKFNPDLFVPMKTNRYKTICYKSRHRERDINIPNNS